MGGVLLTDAAMPMNKWLEYRFPITLTIAAGVSLLVVLLLGMVIAVNFFSSRHTSIVAIHEMSAISARFVEDEIRDHLEPVADQARWMAHLFDDGLLNDDGSGRLGQSLLSGLAATEHVTALVFLRTDMSLVTAFRGGNGETRRIERGQAQNIEFARHTLDRAEAADGGFWNEILYSKVQQRTYLNYVMPVHNDGDFAGVVIAAVSLNDLSQLLGDISAGLRGTVFLMADPESLIAHPNLTHDHPDQSADSPLVGIDRIGDLVLRDFWSDEATDIAVANVPGGPHFRELVVAGKPYVLITQDLHGFGADHWIVGGYLDAEVAWHLLHDGREALAVGFVILIVGIGAAIWFGRTIAKPVRLASTGIAKVAGLQISEVPPLPGSRFVELDNQAKAFNRMLAGLKWMETYMPKSLVRRLMRVGEGGITFRQRDVSVLFTDLVGFTSLSENMTPEQTADLLNAHFELLGNCVEAEGGTIDKFIGDALMAFWGAPDRQADHAARAVRAGVAMVAAIREDNRRRAEAGEPIVRVRIGLHCGPVIVGNIGSPSRINYTVVGDTVNTAERIEALGKQIDPGAEIVGLVSQDVVTASEGIAEFRSEGTHSVKGKSDSIEVYRFD